MGNVDINGLFKKDKRAFCWRNLGGVYWFLPNLSAPAVEAMATRHFANLHVRQPV
jgi:hypothetical protein